VLNEIYPNYLKKLSLKNKIESDEYDKYAIQFAVFTGEQICASVRLIYNSPIGYPTENAMKFNSSNFKRENLAELSRIFINKKYRNLKDTKKIIDGLKKILYFKMKELDIEYSYGSLEKNFLRLLKIYKMRYEIIGECQEHGDFGLRCPCILYTKKLGIDNYEK
jgi:N-acyl-L-homoserine lactone synthetase